MARTKERPKTGNIGPRSGPRPPTEGPRAAQDRPTRPQIGSRLRIKHISNVAMFFILLDHIGAESGPRPPT